MGRLYKVSIPGSQSTYYLHTNGFGGLLKQSHLGTQQISITVYIEKSSNQFMKKICVLLLNYSDKKSKESDKNKDIHSKNV